MKKFFDDYGSLEWLEPEQFYSGPWILYSQTAKDCRGVRFSIVLDEANNEYRYTIL